MTARGATTGATVIRPLLAPETTLRLQVALETPLTGLLALRLLEVVRFLAITVEEELLIRRLAPTTVNQVRVTLADQIRAMIQDQMIETETVVAVTA